MSSVTHRTETEILEGLAEVKMAPSDNGSLEAIVIRPGSEERLSLPRCRLSPEGQRREGFFRMRLM